MALTINIQDSLRKTVEAASGGRNTVIYTAKGQPCYMYVLAKDDLATACAALGISTHPAFIVNGVTKSELLIGQYLGATVNGEFLSLPGAEPDWWAIHDTFVSTSRANGAGFHMMTNAEWAAVALWCYYNGFQPRGNDDYGRSIDVSTERGVDINTGRLALTSGTACTRTRTGSGPVSWRHDNSPFGIADLHGNQSELQAGIRLATGEFNVFTNNDAALGTADFSSGSSAWKAIDGATGALVTPGSAGTVKCARASSGTADYTLYSNGGTFQSIANSTGANPVSAAALSLLKQLCLFPVANSGLGADQCNWNTNSGNWAARRGGSSSLYDNGTNAGIFSVAFDMGVGNAGATTGARVAYVA